MKGVDWMERGLPGGAERGGSVAAGLPAEAGQVAHVEAEAEMDGADMEEMVAVVEKGKGVAAAAVAREGASAWWWRRGDLVAVEQDLGISAAIAAAAAGKGVTGVVVPGVVVAVGIMAWAGAIHYGSGHLCIRSGHRCL